MLKYIIVICVSIITVSVFSPQAGATSQSYNWTNTLGTSNDESARSIDTDSEGNIYTVGHFYDTVDFDSSGATENHTSVGQSDIFLTKYNQSGDHMWTISIGGTSYDNAYGVSVDNSDNIFIVGSYSDTVDFDATGGTDNHTSTGAQDIFISKYLSDGSYGWTRSVGSAFSDSGLGITTDTDGNVYATGTFQGTVDFDDTGGTDNQVTNGVGDIFIVKYASNGTYGWGRSFGSAQGDEPSGIDVDSSNNIYVTGKFYDTVDFDDTGSTDNKTSAGSIDIFITKYSSAGTYGWTKTFGSPNTDYTYALAVSSFDDVFLTGVYYETVDFDASGGTDSHTPPNSNSGIYITHYNSDGSYGWTKTFDGSVDSYGSGNSITTDSQGSVLVGGSFHDVIDFDASSGTDNHTGGTDDFYITKYTREGIYEWTLSLTGSVDSYATPFDIATYSTNKIIAVGYFYDTINFNGVGGTDNRTADGEDIFITSYTEVTITPTPTPTSVTTQSAQTSTSSNTSNQSSASAPQIPQLSTGDNGGGAFTPTGDSHTKGQHITTIIEPKTFTFDAFVSAQSTSISQTNVGGLLPNPFTGIMPTVGKTNAVLAGGNMLGVKTGGSVAWQVGNVQQIWYKAYAPAGSDKSPAKIIPELQKKPSIISLSYTDANLIPPGRPKSKFNAKTLKLAHSVDGVTWKILPTSVVDTKNKTVAALHKVGGYYMVVGR